MSGAITPPFTDWQIDILRHYMKITAEDIERLGGLLTAAGVMEETLPADPRERSLELKKRRNTRPGKPVQQQRRPRNGAGS